MKYIKVDWPESQVVQDFKNEYLEECYPVDDMAFFVPEVIWDLLKNSPDEVLTMED
ncbi:MAG: hypothetical protein UH850_00200 [Paludibacteraceae bacterium]|nr:hypothetical protein [Paludibacteraceae bacterium]